MTLFSKNLRFLRKKGNYNQDEISILFNKRANTIGNWENNKSEPSLAELMKLGEFFHTGTEELLHADLEKLSLYQNSGPGTNESGGLKGRSYPIVDSPGSVANEGNPDAFWLILKELRTVNEKLDSLHSALQSSAFKSNSDKSYH